MSDLLDRLQRLAALIGASGLVRSFGWTVLIYTGFLLVVYLIERGSGISDARYHTRNFAIDVAYTLFYKAGIYQVLLLAAVTNVLSTRAGYLQLHLLRDIPWPVGLALFWIGGDFLTYWWHRLQHRNRFLWAFHSVHHSQEHLTLFTASRRHPLENLSMDVLLYFGVFHFLLGIPTRGWAPLAAFITCFAAIQHAPLDWKLGPLGKIFAGPRFHAFHHSADPRHANANYAFLFSTWDYLFKTAIPDGEPRPVRYGLDGIQMPESLWGQLVTPFRLLRRRPADLPEPHAEPRLAARR